MAQVDNYDWLNLIPTGWKELGRAMIEECEAAEPDFEIIDLKEKFEMICMYPHPYTEKIREIEHKYEQISAHTCCRCGKPATKRSTGWILPFCDNCADNRCIPIDN